MKTTCHITKFLRKALNGSLELIGSSKIKFFICVSDIETSIFALTECDDAVRKSINIGIEEDLSTFLATMLLELNGIRANLESQLKV